MRTLILGGTGTIGRAVSAACDDSHYPHLTTSYRDLAGSVPLDARDVNGVRELVADYQPDVTIYAVRTDDPVGIETVATAVRDAGGVLVAFTTPAVFGPCTRAMREDDAVNPADARGRADVGLERTVRDRLPERHLLIRTCGVFDAGRFGEVGRMLHRLGRGEVVRRDNTRIVMPTYAPDLAQVAIELVREGHTGTYHVVGPERHTEFTFARLVAHLFGHDADLVVTTGDENSTDRPGRLLIDRNRIRALLGPDAIRRPADGLRAIRERLRPAERRPVPQAA